jgi:RND superfamily putative drug exporter
MLFTILFRALDGRRGVPALNLVGLGLAVAVFVDATVVRSVLVPATMELLGRANWWIPHGLIATSPRSASVTTR